LLRGDHVRIDWLRVLRRLLVLDARTRISARCPTVLFKAQRLRQGVGLIQKVAQVGTLEQALIESMGKDQCAS